MAIAGGNIFDPRSLSPALWLSDTGSDPSVWEDLSGNGRHATQATVANRPTIVENVQNGRQVRRFDGVNDWLETAAVNIAQPYTSYAVFQSSTTSSLSIVLRGASLSTLTLVIHRAAAGEVSGMNAGTLYAPFPTNTSWQIFGTLGNGSNSQAYRNGIAATSGNAGTNAVSSFGVGVDTINSNFFNGDIAEILVFPRSLSTSERKAVENYLAKKWGIGFNPLSLSPALWLSDTGSNPAQWDDISGNNRHATQATVANQPAIIQNGLAGRQVRRFDGTDKLLCGDIQSTLTNMTIFVVSLKTSSQLGGQTYQKLISTSDPSQPNTSAVPNIQVFAGWESSQTGTPVVYGPDIRVMTYTDGRNLRNLHVGCDASNSNINQFIGNIAEILVFPSALSNTDRREVERYLAQKWNIIA